MQFTPNDLVLKLKNGSNAGALYPVKTQKCLLGHNTNENGEKSAKCAIFRGPNGTAIQAFGCFVQVNGEDVESHWLNEGDQLQVGDSALEIVQLGLFENGDLIEEPAPSSDSVPTTETDEPAASSAEASSAEASSAEASSAEASSAEAPETEPNAVESESEDLGNPSETVESPESTASPELETAESIESPESHESSETFESPEEIVANLRFKENEVKGSTEATPEASESSTESTSTSESASEVANHQLVNELEKKIGELQQNTSSVTNRFDELDDRMEQLTKTLASLASAITDQPAAVEPPSQANEATEASFDSPATFDSAATYESEAANESTPELASTTEAFNEQESQSLESTGIADLQKPEDSEASRLQSISEISKQIHFELEAKAPEATINEELQQKLEAQAAATFGTTPDEETTTSESLEHDAELQSRLDRALSESDEEIISAPIPQNNPELSTTQDENALELEAVSATESIQSELTGAQWQNTLAGSNGTNLSAPGTETYGESFPTQGGNWEASVPNAPASHSPSVSDYPTPEMPAPEAFAGTAETSAEEIASVFQTNEAVSTASEIDNSATVGTSDDASAEVGSTAATTEEANLESQLKEIFSTPAPVVAEEPVAEPEPVEEPQEESVSELLARMGYNPDEDSSESHSAAEAATSHQETPAVEESFSTPEPAANLETAVTPAATAEAAANDDASEGDDSETSVEDYMNRLLGRTKPEAAPAVDDSKIEAKIKKEEPRPEPVKLLTPSEFKPSKSAPEKSANLDAMRELANHSNRQALAKSSTQRAKAIAITNFSVMGLGIALATYLLISSQGFSDSYFWMGAATLGLSFGLGIIGGKSLHSLVRKDKPVAQSAEANDQENPETAIAQ